MAAQKKRWLKGGGIISVIVQKRSIQMTKGSTYYYKTPQSSHLIHFSETMSPKVYFSRKLLPLNSHMTKWRVSSSEAIIKSDCMSISLSLVSELKMKSQF